jgi:hypothetical protein
MKLFDIGLIPVQAQNKSVLSKTTLVPLATIIKLSRYQ